MPSPLDIRAILETLAKHRVELIVVGGVGCVLQGAPIATFDLATLILVEEQAGREKDRAVLATLRATLAERDRR